MNTTVVYESVYGNTRAVAERLDKSPWFTGVASRGIAKRRRRLGYDVVGSASFLVEDSEGPLAEGELDRAREWGRKLAGLVPAGAAPRAARADERPLATR